EGALQAAPGALIGSTLNKENYKGGNAILNILESAAVQVAGAAAMSGGVGTLHSLVQADLIKVRTDPEYQERVFKKYEAKNPGKTFHDFLTNLDHLIVTHTHDGFKDPRLQEQMRAQLLEHLPPSTHKTFANVPIEVLPDAEFKQFTGSRKGKAVTIIQDGKLK